jgi:hypothetical protein
MRTILVVVAAAAPVVAPSGARAEVQLPDPDRGAAVVGGKVGVILPFDGLGVNGTGGIEVGYLAPWLKRSFGLIVDLTYAQPTADGTVTNDPRVGSGTYSWHLTQRELVLSPMVLYRLSLSVLGRFVPYIAFGPRIYFLESLVDGTVGTTTILTTTEKSTKGGIGLPVGLEVRLGPGALMAEFLFEWGPLNHTATGDSTTTMGGTIQVGYRFQL